MLPGLRVDLARLAAYERVCGFPTGADALPVTYPHVLGFPVAMRLMSGRDFPLPLLGLVHTSISVTRRAATPATAVYELTVYVEGLARHRRGTEAAVVTELRDDGGAEPVWESRSTYLARHRVDGGAAPRQEGGPASAQAEPLPVRAEWRLAGDVGRRYGAASGDRNPIHLHPLTARLFGFPRAIAHGMWTVARCLAAHGTPDAAVVRAEFARRCRCPGRWRTGRQTGASNCAAGTGGACTCPGRWTPTRPEPAPPRPPAPARAPARAPPAAPRAGPSSGRPGPPRRSSSGSPPPAWP